MYSWSNQIKASLLYKAHWLDHKSCSWHQTQFCQICHFLTIVSRHCFSSRLQMFIHRSTQAYSMCCDGPSSFYSNKAQTQLLFVVENLFRCKLGENPGFVRGVVVATSFPGSLFFPSSPCGRAKISSFADFCTLVAWLLSIKEANCITFSSVYSWFCFHFPIATKHNGFFIK